MTNPTIKALEEARKSGEQLTFLINQAWSEADTRKKEALWHRVSTYAHTHQQLEIAERIKRDGK